MIETEFAEIYLSLSEAGKERLLSFALMLEEISHSPQVVSSVRPVNSEK